MPDVEEIAKRVEANARSIALMQEVVARPRRFRMELTGWPAGIAAAAAALGVSVAIAAMFS